MSTCWLRSEKVLDFLHFKPRVQASFPLCPQTPPVPNWSVVMASLFRAIRLLRTNSRFLGTSLTGNKPRWQFSSCILIQICCAPDPWLGAVLHSVLAGITQYDALMHSYDSTPRRKLSIRPIMPRGGRLTAPSWYR